MRERGRYFVYIACSASWTLYTGITNDIERRMWEHKNKLFPGFTAKFNIDRLVYYETFRDVHSALRREKQIKAWTRAKRIALVKTMNPKWDDLSRQWGKPFETIKT
jgi:putative endonuclease